MCFILELGRWVGWRNGFIMRLRTLSVPDLERAALLYSTRN